jgi:hypothetical protein
LDSIRAIGIVDDNVGVCSSHAANIAGLSRVVTCITVLWWCVENLVGCANPSSSFLCQ